MRPVETLSEKQRRLYKLALAHKDISTAEFTCAAFLRMLEATQGSLPYEISYAFMTAIVICYARPFVDNKSTGVLPKEWKKFKTRPLQGAHEAMMKARHEVYAHSDSDVAPLKIIPQGATIPEVNQVAKGISWMIASYEFPSHAVVPFRDCCQDLKLRLETEIKILLAAVVADTGKTEAFEIRWRKEGG